MSGSPPGRQEQAHAYYIKKMAQVYWNWTSLYNKIVAWYLPKLQMYSSSEPRIQ